MDITMKDVSNHIEKALVRGDLTVYEIQKGALGGRGDCVYFFCKALETRGLQLLPVKFATKGVALQ